MSEDFSDEEQTKPFVRPQLPSTYWLTRGRKHGELANEIEVWAVLPRRLRMEDGDVMWLAPLELIDVVDTYIDEWSIAKCLKECRVYPETDRECIRVGDDVVEIPVGA